MLMLNTISNMVNAIDPPYIGRMSA